MFEKDFEWPKALTMQEIKVKCIKEDDVYETFQVGKEYDATYDPPCFLSLHAWFNVYDGNQVCGWTWESFYKYFNVLTEGFEGTPKIILEYGKD